MVKPKFFKRFFLCAFIILLGALPVRAAESDAALQTALVARLNNYLASRAKIEHISAISLSISLHGASANINVTAGTTRYGGGALVTPDNLFQIGSNTKAFTSAIILQLEAAGRLSIDDPLGKFLPQYPLWSKITIRRLLNMTSTIPTYDNDPQFAAAYVANPYRWFTPAELVQYCYPTTPGALKPTHGYSYSNTNYLLAEMIIEKVTGNSYQQEVQRRILRALDLSAMYYSPHLYPVAVTKQMVSGYFYNHSPENKPYFPLLGKDVRLFSLSWTQGAGGAVGSPQALSRWARALYQDDNFLAPAQRRELMTVVSTKSGKQLASTTPDEPRGFGLGVVEMTQKETGTIWFYEGETLGYRMVYAYFPKQDAVVAVGLNSQPDSNQDHVGQLVVSVYETLRQAGKI